MKKPCLLAVGTAICVPAIAPAQEAQQTIALEQVVVTAQRREESLQNVPISVSAFSADDLVKSNIAAAKDYLQFTPNVAFTEDGQGGSRSIKVAIRGVSNINSKEGTNQNSVGYYIDELNVGATASGVFNPQLNDMERIEVLRGPQGTYFGRNALGGAVNISTKKPDENFYGEGSAYYGSFATWGASGVLNVPLSDRVFVRAVAAYDKSDGVVENINPSGSENSGYDYKSGRIALRALATDSLTFDLSVSYTNEDAGFDGDVPSGVLNLDTQSIFGSDFQALPDGTGFFPQNDDRVNHNTDEYNRNRVTIVNGRVTYDFGGFELRSITGYIESANRRLFDQDNISADAIVRHNVNDGKTFSQELRLQSTGENRLDWTVGAMYAQDEVDMFNSIQAGSETTYTDPATGEVIGLLPPIPAGFRINENNGIFKTQSAAAFADITWKATAHTALTLGARYTRDKIDNRAFDVVAFESPVPDTQGSRTFSDFSPRLVFKYMPNDDLTAYATVARGYKAGGVDLNPLATTSFEPEKLTNYELGLKAQLADGRVRLEGSVFYLDWKDLQAQTNYLAVPGDIGSSIDKTLNAAEASSQGVELMAQAQLTRDWQVGAGAGYLDATFDSFPNAVLNGNNQVDLSGRTIPKSPKFTANAYVDYSTDVAPDLTLFVRPEWAHRSETTGNLEGVAAQAGMLGLPEYPYVMPAYDVVNLRMGLRSTSWDLLASVENVFDEDYFNGTDNGFGLAGIRIRPHPRLWSIRFTYRTH